MQAFVNGIFDFVKSITDAIGAYIIGQGNAQLNFWTTFLSKELISGDLINITLTYRDILSFVIPMFLVGLVIYLFVKFVFKLLSLFSLR